jgi:polyisoprenoid-binding protein YceI
MKAIFSLALAALFSLSLSAQSYQVANENTKVQWKAAKVSGEHWGTVSVKSGNLEFSKGALSAGTFVMNMQSITVDDIQGEWADKLKGHLNSEDFFNTANNPEAKLVIKKAKSEGTNKYLITADLTIKGITKSVEFPATVVVTDDQVKGRATITVDRTAYDIKYGSGSFFEGLGDKMIYDDFTLTVDLSAVRAGS